MFFKVWFKDGTHFISNGNYMKTLWHIMPNKPIQSISFRLPDGNYITLNGYEQYNHETEITQNFYGKTGQKAGKPTIRCQYLKGKVKDKITCYRISLFQSPDSRYKVGDITRRELEWGKDDNGKKPTTGWKQGIK